MDFTAKKIPRLCASEFLLHIYPTLLLALLLLPPPLLLLLLVLVAGDVTFFNKSYQKDAPCETIAAVIPSPTIFKKMNKAQSPTAPFAGSCCVCHQPILIENALRSSMMLDKFAFAPSRATTASAWAAAMARNSALVHKALAS
jgi:hypothetical protein